MPIGRFLRMIVEFSEFPPLAEIGRAFVKIEKNQEPPREVAAKHERQMKQMLTPTQPAPEWFRKGYQKLIEGRKNGK